MLRVNGFYGHVQRNDLRSAAMFAGFVVAFQLVAAVVLALPLAFIDAAHSPVLGPTGYLARYAPMVLAGSAILFVVRFLRHVATVRASVEFKEVDRRTAPRLVGTVEVQAIAAGLPTPRVGLIDSDALNAFACGIGRRSSFVVATRGLVDALDDEELSAVVAHEIVHIRNGDIRLMAAANVMMENLHWLERRNVLRMRGVGKVLLGVLLPPFLILSLIAGLVTTAAMTIARASRLLISSSREFVADAEAVRMTHNPAALISALRRIEGRSAITGLTPGTDAMMIDGDVEGAFASHPTIAERIAVLMRLSGAMAESGALRRDTRPLDLAMAHRAAFGRRVAARDSSAPRSIIQRVNAGAATNVFGLTPKVKRLLILGFGGLAAIQFWAAWSMQSKFKPVENRMAAAPSPWESLRRTAKTDPLAAGCFWTERYTVGDRGLHAISAGDGIRMSGRIGGPSGGSSEIDLDRYLGLKAASVRAVETAGADGLDDALLAYVGARKTLLMTAHRFFGEPGLRRMRAAYDSPADRTILDRLRSRLPALVVTPPLGPEIVLLLDAPERFLPCAAKNS